MTLTQLSPNALAGLTIVGVLAVLALSAWLTHRRDESDQLQQRFGSE